MNTLRVFFLFGITALAEIVGCYLTWRVFKQGKSGWLLTLAATALRLFAFQPAPQTA